MPSQPVTFPCPFCTRRMGVPAELLGRQVRCPHCKQVVVAPVTAGNPPAPPAPAPVVVVMPPTEPELRAFNIPPKKEGADSILSEPDESDDEVFGSHPGARLTTLPVEPPPPAPPEPDATAPVPDDPFGFGSSPKPAAPVRAAPPLVTATVFDLPPSAAPARAAEVPRANPFGDFDSGATTPSLPQKPAPTPVAKPQAAVPQPVAPGANPFADFEADPSTVPLPVPVKFEKPPDASATEKLPGAAPVPPRKKPRGEDPDDTPVRAGRARPAPSPGGAKTVALVVLAGYALVATALAVYGLFFKSGGASDTGHPLSTIPDNFGEFDPVSRKKVSRANFAVDGELPAAQRAPLGGKVVIGQLEVQPLRVEKRALLLKIEGSDEKEKPITTKTAPALVLTLDIKNTGDLPIFPADPAFSRRATKTDLTITRLVVGPKVFFGGEIEWPLASKYKKKIEEQQANDAIPLEPNESREYVVFTEGNLELVRAAEAAKEPLQWRVQVRRGLIKYKGKDVPVTAVIGVDFKGGDIRVPQ